MNWVEVDLSAIAFNLSLIRNALQENTQIIAVVKADAYGHGLLPVARTAVREGAVMMAVANIPEGKQLREAGFDKPVLILGGAFPEMAEDIVSSSLIQTVYSSDMVEALQSAASKEGKVAHVHIKVETGMNRLGVRSGDELQALLDSIRRSASVHVDGMFSHFAAADDDPAFTRLQFEQFQTAVRQVRREGLNPKLHMAHSAATLSCPFAHMDYVRAGIAMYGLSPGEGLGEGLRPALTWRTRVVHVKEIQAGDTVSYGREFRAEGTRKIATLPVGYADGYPRALGGKATVLIGGRRVPVIGRVCMDYCMADVTEIPDVKAGDPVVMIGCQGEACITAGEVASWMDTIHYEVVTGIGKRVPRLYHGQPE